MFRSSRSALWNVHFTWNTKLYYTCIVLHVFYIVPVITVAPSTAPRAMPVIRQYL